MGKRAGYSVYDSSTTGEFLWDMIWEKFSERSYWLELAAELELTANTDEDLLEDFYKVLNAMSRLKVFVGTCPTRASAGTVREEISWAARYRRHRIAGEHLVAILITYDGRTSHQFSLWVACFNLSRADTTAKWRRIQFESNW